MNILVIGNGFDLAHRLPTKYSDFLKFVQAYELYANSKIGETEKYYDYFNRLKNKKLLLFAEIGDLIKDNLWIRYFQSILAERSEAGKDGWIDFESEISVIIQTLDEVRINAAPKFKEGEERVRIDNKHSIILDTIFTKGQIGSTYYNKKTITYQKTLLLDDLNRLTRLLEIYLADYVPTLYDTCNYLTEIQALDIHGVLSFNYTDTYQKLYDRVAHVEYDYIHGKADVEHTIEDCNLILGIDEYHGGDAQRKDNAFIQFKKFYQRIYKKTGCKYIDWLRDSIEQRRMTPAGNRSETQPRYNIYIYGHSLDITDGDIIGRLITNADTRTTIFYHNNDALGSQIANLVKIIGEQKLIEMTEGSDAAIVFKQSSSEITTIATDSKARIVAN